MREKGCDEINYCNFKGLPDSEIIERGLMDSEYL